MSDSLNLEVIEQKLNNVTELIEQQGKSGVFFDSFTKQILEKIHVKLDDISNFETNELISYLTGELKKELEERHTYIEQRLTGVQGQLQVVQANLADSIKTPEVAQVFSQLSDNLMAFSRDLGTQTRYFNNAIAEVQNVLNRNDFDQKLAEQTGVLKTDLNAQKTALDNGLVDMQEGFQKIFKVIEANAPFEAINVLGSEVSILQTSLTNLVSAVAGINNKQATILEGLDAVLTKEDFGSAKEEVSSILSQTMALGEALKFIANKSDLAALEEKLTYTVEMVANIKDVANLSNDEHKNLLNAYFTNLYNLISTLTTKEDGSKLKEHFETLKETIETNSSNFDDAFSVTQNDIKTLIPMLSGVATQDNLKELSQYAISGLEKLNSDFIANLDSTKQFTEEKINELKANLEDINTSLSGFSTTLDNANIENSSYLKIELTKIYDLMDDFKGKLSALSRESFETISTDLKNNSAILTDKVEALETAINSSQDILEGNLSENISQLKDFSQTLVSSIQEIISTAEDNRTGIQNTLSQNHSALLTRVDGLSESFAATGLTNKTEILEQINTLKELIEAAKPLLEDKSGFDTVCEKVENIETILENHKQSVLMADNQLHQAFVEQNTMFATVKETVQSLAIKLATLNDTALENKAEITNLLTDKFSMLDSSLGNVFDGLKTNSVENKSALISEIAKISKETDEIKTLINDTAENQATKQVLGIIFESVTKKLSEISTIFDDSKTFTLEVYDGLKGLITGLKEELSNVSGLIDRSDEFATDVKNNIDATLTQLNIDAVQKIEKIKDYFKEISSENKEELASQIETIEETVSKIAPNFEDVLYKIGKIEEKTFDSSASIETKLSEDFETLNEKISIVTSNLQNNSYQNKEEIIAEISNLKGSFSEIKESITSTGAKIPNEEYFDSQVDKIIGELNKISEKTHTEVDLSFKNSYDGIIEGITNAFEIIKKDIEETVGNLKTSNGSLEDRLSEMKDKVSYEINEIKALIQENSSSIDNYSQESKSHINSSFETVGDKLSSISSTQNDTKAEILSEITKSFQVISQRIESSSGSDTDFKEEIKFEFKKSIDEISEKLFRAGDDNLNLKSELIAELQKSYNAIVEKVSTGEIKEILEEQFTQVSQSLEDKFAALNSKTEFLNSDIKSEIRVEAQRLLSDVKRALEIVEENVISKLNSEKQFDIKSELENSNEEISKKIGEISTEVSEKINFVIDEVINTLTKDIENGLESNVGAVAQAVEDKISYLKDDISDAILKISQLDGLSDNLKETLIDELDEYRTDINEGLSALSEDVKKYLESNTGEIKEELQAVHNDTKIIKELIEKYQSGLESLADMDLTSYHNDIKKVINKEIDSLKEDIEQKLSKLLAADKGNGAEGQLENISEEIKEQIDELKEIIISAKPQESNWEEKLSEKFEEAQSKISSSINALQNNNDEIINAVKAETTSIKEVISKYQKEIENISDIDFSSYQNESQEFVKTELKNLKEQFILNLTSVFENISFIEESQEIQDAIFENADEIKKEIDKLRHAVINNSNSPVGVDEKFEKLKDLLSESIKKDLKALMSTSEGSSDYLYTLPDVEMDLAKMRLAINDMSNLVKKSKEDEIDYSLDLNERLVAIDEIRNDISSISKRTNKLILTSEDANKNLQEHLDDLKAATNYITQKCEMLDNKRIEHNVEDIKSLMMSSLKSDKTLNEAFMFLAEWIDNTAVCINTIDQNVLEFKRDTKLVDEIADIKDILSGLMSSSPEGSQGNTRLDNLEDKLDEIIDKFNTQETKLRTIEKKIEATTNGANGLGEIHSVLEFIASQASAANENSRGSKFLLEKMELMEHKMSKLETNISKLTSLIDEE